MVFPFIHSLVSGNCAAGMLGNPRAGIVLEDVLSKTRKKDLVTFI